ncbi:NmrA domain-containing protein [Mycena sanguinolenta]|uniref:NmrA domain-containing protein n=1 Tax=Mycena sanguinolenta TaxID=230812 RepID=A0A8H7CR72_9AGAR|nr:NmrA domain-containing protein [Mycena sanguinolenta]
MHSSRIVAVFGATGVQGSAVVEQLLTDGTFTPRAITRNPESEASLKLKARGVEVTKGDTGDKASLVAALRGSEAVFALTVPVIPELNRTTGPDEIVQGKNIVDAAKEVGVKFFLFTSLPDVSKLSGGKYANNLPIHSDKQVVQEYLKSSGLNHVVFYLGGFAENFFGNHFLRKTSTGFNISIPKYSPDAQANFTWISRDLAAASLAVFKSYTDPSKDISGRVYPVITATMTLPELATMLAQALGVEVTFTPVSSCGIPVLDNMFEVRSESNGLYTETPVPNPELFALGANFGTMDEFIDKEFKKHFGK